MNKTEVKPELITQAETETAEKPIEISHLSKSFGEESVLTDVSLNLYNGENLVVLGKSGTGKSVLIKIIIGLLSGFEGMVSIFGKDIKSLTKNEMNLIRQKIGFLFQSGALYDSMTVRQNLEFSLVRIKKRLTKAQINEKVNEVLENVGLIEALDKMPSQLSGGMRKRISLARSIILDPQIMLYDEPTTGLDPITSNEISLLINEIQEKYKTSSMIITHDIRCAQVTADRIIMLKDGGVYKEGSLESFENDKDTEISSFFL